MDGVDDLGAVDPLQIDRRHPEVRVPELALDDHQRHALARHLDSVSMPELMGCKPPTHPGGGRRIAQLDTDPGR